MVSDRVYSQLARRTTNEEQHSKQCANTKGKCVRAHMEAGALGGCIRGAGVAPYTEVCHIHQLRTNACIIRLRLHDNAGVENARKSFRIHGSFTRYEEQNVKVVHQNGRKPKRWPRWKNLKTEKFCRINLGV